MEQYADDSTLSATGATIENINDKLTASCQAVSNWMASNQLKLNADKTHILTLGTDRRLQIPDYEITVIVDGLTFQSKWHDQIKELKSKLKKRLVGLSHIKYQENCLELLSSIVWWL